jgi:hypothetical protein
MWNNTICSINEVVEVDEPLRRITQTPSNPPSKIEFLKEIIQFLEAHPVLKTLLLTKSFILT